MHENFCMYYNTAKPLQHHTHYKLLSGKAGGLCTKSNVRTGNQTTVQKGYKYNSPNTRTPQEQLGIFLPPPKSKDCMSCFLRSYSWSNTTVEQSVSHSFFLKEMMEVGQRQHERYYIYNYDQQSPFSITKQLYKNISFLLILTICSGLKVS